MKKIILFMILGFSSISFAGNAVESIQEIKDLELAHAFIKMWSSIIQSSGPSAGAYAKLDASVAINVAIDSYINAYPENEPKGNQMSDEFKTKFAEVALVSGESLGVLAPNVLTVEQAKAIIEKTANPQIGCK